MVSKKLNLEAIQYINLFSKITGTRARDCFEYADHLIFEVAPFMISKTIGENGTNIKKLSAMIKRKIKVIATTQDMEEFIKSVIYPVHFKNLQLENNELIIFAPSQSKALLIGRGGAKLEQLKEILKNHFNVKKLRVL